MLTSLTWANRAGKIVVYFIQEIRMFAIKGFYDGNTVSVERAMPVTQKCEVIVTFLVDQEKPGDNGSLAYLFRGYEDDHIREPLVDFGEAVGSEQW
jgi:hypothetical protein